MTVCRSPRRPDCGSEVVTHTALVAGTKRVHLCARCAAERNAAIDRQVARLNRRRPQPNPGGNP